MSSNILFCDKPSEDNVSSGHDTHYADQHRQHSHSSSENFVQTEIKANQDKQIDLSEIDGAERHFHQKTSSDIFFRHLPTEGDVSSGSISVDRDEILFKSAGHDIRDADQKQGERLHYHSSSED